MKKAFLSVMAALLLLCGCTKTVPPQPGEQIQDSCLTAHTDIDDNGLCDVCGENLIVVFDFYCVNDLHGKIADGINHPGVDELTTYLKRAGQTDDNVIILSAGDMWQGSSESNLTRGSMMTDWMNELDFSAMAVGNHEFDWGEKYIESNAAAAEFPILAINIFDRDTNKRVSYCGSSVTVEMDGLRIGIIGAIGDCYSSISGDKTEGVYFKTGSELTALVMDEAEKLREDGVDFIVYVLHDGMGRNNITSATTSELGSYYDISLSDGYVDLVFEGHTHRSYAAVDKYGVYHLQGGGDNRGITHAEVEINSVTKSTNMTDVETVSTDKYTSLPGDPIVEQLLSKYEEDISFANGVLGKNKTKRSGRELRQLAAELYYQTALEKWGESYDIVLAGGFFSVRSPGYLAAGDVKYSDLQALFPFDNELVLCTVKGKELKEKFFESTNSNYFISYGEYGQQVKTSLDMNATYYIMVDTYSSTYAPNHLTDVGRILRTFKIKKNVEVTDNGKIII